MECANRMKKEKKMSTSPNVVGLTIEKSSLNKILLGSKKQTQNIT